MLFSVLNVFFLPKLVILLNEKMCFEISVNLLDLKLEIQKGVG